MSCGCNGHWTPNFRKCTCNAFDGHVNPVSYSIGDVPTGGIIYASKWTELYNNINTERARRGHGGIGNPVFSGNIEVNDFNTLTGGINYYWSDGYVDSSTQINAGHINYLIDKIQAAGAVCVCQCNYCTCQCDYCTCNCNYGCTCYCNYSDKRLKTNIKFLRKENGIKIYSFNYIWDKNTIHIGVMAQEILKSKHKTAVKQDKNGYYMVDYSMIPVVLKGI